MTFRSIHSVFDRLDDWRNFPAYALERRADIFFSFFLVAILDSEFCIGAESVVLPEFPLKKDENNQSRKVDFFVVATDRQRSFLVELKTDRKSLSDPQLEYLNAARSKRLSTLIEDVKSIAIKSKGSYRLKYLHLLNRLADLNLVHLGKQVRLDSFDPPNYICKYIDDTVLIEPIDMSPEAVCIVPEIPSIAEKYPTFKWISFDEVAEGIKKEGLTGKRFAESLKSWAHDDAGFIKPIKPK